MKFIGTLISWFVASAVAFGLSVVAAQTVQFNELAALTAQAGGDPLGLGNLVSAIVSSMVATLPLLGVVAVGLMIAFFVASLVKAIVPPLAAIAYPVAGGVAMAVIVYAIANFEMAYDGLPGTSGPLGFGLQVAVGMIAGVVFEIYRPR